MTEATEIKFYSATRKYGEFSNFYPAKLKISKKEWPTSEHYFQAMKFLDGDTQELIRKLKTPAEAKRKGGSKRLPLREDWETVKDDVMRKALKTKFTQHRDLKKKLLETYPNKLSESTKRDSYWADGGDGSGKNMLGVLLVELRDQFIKSNQEANKRRRDKRKANKKENKDENEDDDDDEEKSD